MARSHKVICFLVIAILGLLLAESIFAQSIPSIKIGVEEAKSPKEVALAVKLLLLMTVLSLAPAILMTMTSFVRIAIVLGILRQALGAQQVPPNQVLIGLALFITYFVMSPVISQINTTSVEPYMAGKMDQTEAIKAGFGPLKEFMLRQTRKTDLGLFLKLSDAPRPKNKEELSPQVVIPAFIISELKTAFQIGFMVFLPFIVIDIVVSSILLSMGMMVLPPVIISLPFKLMLFVLVDGWNLVVGSLVKSFT